MNARQKPRDLVTFISLLVVAVILGKVQSSFRDRGKMDPLTMAVGRLTDPTIRLTSNTFSLVGAFFTGIGRAPALERQIKNLQTEASVYQQQKDQISQLQSTINQLKSLAGFPVALRRKKVAADIIALYPYENRLTLDAGATQGIKPDMPVITGQGLLGTVQTVSAHESQVVLITSPAIQIGAMALRNPPVVGLLRGEDPTTLNLDFLNPKANVQVGDDITTSGYSKVIPRGIPIGRVIRVIDNPDFGTRSALVFPWASVGATREVYVIE